MKNDKIKNFINKWMSLPESQKDSLARLLVFLFAFLPKIIFCLDKYPFYMLVDEPSLISAAGIVYPLDWGEAISSQGTSYYGGGFSVLLAVFFYLFKDPVIIYRLCLIAFALIQSLGALIVFSIIRKHYPNIGLLYASFLSVASSYLIVRQATSLINEMVLYFIVWLIIWIILKLIDEHTARKSFFIYSFLLGCVFAYSLMVHTRMIILIPMLLFCWALCMIVSKKSIISLPAFFASFVPGWYLSNIFKNAVIGLNFSATEATVLNSEITMDLSHLLDLSTIKPYLMSQIGPLVTISLATFGVIAIPLCLFWKYSFDSVFRRNKLIGHITASTNRFHFYVITLFLGAGVFATLFIQPIQGGWITDLKHIINDLGEGTSIYGLKIITYVRYFGPFVGPLCIFTLINLFESYKSISQRLVRISSIVCFVFNVIWITYIYPYVCFWNETTTPWIAYGIGNTFSTTNGYNYYFWGSILLFIILAIIYVLLQRNGQRVLIVIITLFLIWQYSAISAKVSVPLSREKCVNTAEAIREVDSLDSIEELFVDHYPTIYQMMFYDSKVHPELPSFDIEKGIVIVENYDSYIESLAYGWKCISWDVPDTYYVFVKGEAYSARIIDCGYQLIDFQPVNIVLTDDSFSESGSDSDSTLIKTKKYYSFTTGTYSFRIDSNSYNYNDVSLNLVTSGTSRYIVSQKIQEGKCTFSVPHDGRMNIRLRSDNSGELLSFDSISIVKLSPAVYLEKTSQPSLQKVIAAFSDEDAGQVAFLNNRSFTDFDSRSLSNETGSDFKFRNELEILEDNYKYVLCFTDNDWQRLLGPYKVNTFTSAFVLLEKRDSDTEYYYSIKKDYGTRALLTRGTYRFRFNLKKGVKMPQDGVYCYIIAESSSRGSSKFWGYINRIPVTIVNKGICEAELNVDYNLSHWMVALFDSKGNPLDCSYIRYNKKVSAAEQSYASASDLLARNINLNNIKDDIAVHINSYNYSSELVSSYFKRKINTDAHLVITLDADKLPDRLDENYVLIEGTTLESVYKLIQDGYTVHDAASGCVFMTKNNAKLISTSGIKWQIDNMLTSEFYYAFSGKKSISVPAGTYMVFLKDMPSLLMSTFGESPLTIETEDGKSLSDSIIGLERIPAFENCNIAGGKYDTITKEVIGEDAIKLHLPGVKMVKNKKYTVSITFRGSVKTAELSSYDMTKNPYMNVTTSKIEEVEAGTFCMTLEISPTYSRDNNEIVFSAQFDGAFEIVDLNLQ